MPGTTKLGNNRVRGIPILPNLPLSLSFTQGNIYHVKPYSGSDSNTGLTEEDAIKTLPYAQTLATADQNDIVLLYSESNTAAYTTDYQTTTLSWAKDGVHLIGINSGNPYNQRSRVAWASTASSSSNIPLVTVSGDNCYVANISFSVGSSDANLAFGVNVTGDRNKFENCAFVWPTNATSDAAGGYALKLDAADECLFQNCTIGSFTTDTGTAANSGLLIDSGCSMDVFENCIFICRAEHATNSPHVTTADNASIGFGCIWFKRCSFIHTSSNAAYTLTGAMTITASQTDGRIVIHDCNTNATKWDNTDANMILVTGNATPAADTVDVALAV